MSFSKNKMRSRRQTAHYVREILAARFPKCFSASEAIPKKPLKVGIGLDVMLMLPELSAYAVALALEDYTWGRRYCESMKRGAPRIGLDGEEDGFVTDQEAAQAAHRIFMFDQPRVEPQQKDEGEAQ